MLTISGTAEYILADERYGKGDRHAFTLFSVDENFEDNLEKIEKYLNGLGWDEIVIEEVHAITSIDDVEHAVLKQGYELAEQQDMSFVINNTPATATA